ncbi:SDR family oxidoreductase [Brevibacterium casei]|uniref:Sulfoacetaldehyde reductase n=1 Tax=Brevibacterium casei CIP 102111 TaxID=1255625 RepID=A0A2H1JLE2_9MICO|nr:SDR family NAD(P)-dependent oxidoreductase [Brevibacterium casei]QPR39274.1 SDR family NAD(P)-dependent oxidoreductase [Brevibacterium casei]QPR43440.1 SDR family NAD(P)-dependent oxidoreductase [Brevibacterium casei]SMX88287.1 sulfoacetaldehyde reductase [Brevibacterium casei CIP 102111]
MTESTTASAEVPHVITGGARGVGLATARRLLDRGDSVVVIDRNPVPDEFADHPKLTYFEQDVADLAGLAELGATIRQRWPRCASVIACAGVTYVGSFPDTEFAKWNEVLTTNITGAVHIVHAVLPSLEATAEAGERADVITIGSIADQAYFDDATIYGACSAALKAFADHLRIELRERNVRVSNIAPGYIRGAFAEFLGGLEQEYTQLGEGLLLPDDVAHVIEFTLDQPAGVHLGDLDIVATAQGWA